MKRSSIKLTSLLFALLLLAGCAKEVEVGDGDGDATGNGTTGPVSVLLSLEVPGAAASRAITPAQESTVRNVDIFVFDKTGKLADWKYGILNAAGNGFTARLAASRDAQDTYRLMVLANARHITYPLFGDNSSTALDSPGGKTLNGHAGKTYDEVYGLLKTAMPATNAATSAQFGTQGIPMWGMLKDPVQINENNRSFSMDLVRSVALIEVGTNTTPSVDVNDRAVYAEHPDFSIEAVYFYNGNTSFSPIPAEGKYNYTDKKVDGYSLPAGVAKFGAPVEYSDITQAATVKRTAPSAAFPSGKGYAITGAIYAAEAEVDMGGTYGDQNHAARPCILVKGLYKPAGAADFNTDPCYYRIDIRPEGSLKDLLRNNNYQITIKTVTGPGKTTPEEALASINAEMTVVVKTWGNAVVGGTVVDGEKYLKATPYHFDIDKWGGNHSVTIETNVPLAAGKSWSATVVGGGTWLTLPAATSGISGDGLRFDVQPVPGGSASSFSRSAKLQIVAGTMTYAIVVTQTNRDGEHLLRLSHSELVFDGRKWNGTEWTNPDPQELNINWGPQNYDYQLMLSDYTGGGVDVTGLPEGTPVTDNDPIYSIAPLAIDENDPHVAGNPFYERSSNLTISALDQFGNNPITKSVRIRQIFYSLVVTGDEDYYYQGLSYTFNVKSNTAWKATFGGDESIFASRSGTSGSGNTTAGQNFSFKISPTATVGATATVTFSSADDNNPRFLPQTFTIMAQDYDLPNSYIVAPGATQQIPVRKAYRVWKLDRDLGGVNLKTKSGVRDAKLLWQDEPDLIQSVTHTMAADESNATISVTAHPTKTGNAVVAFTIDGQIYWSWHIWVTNYDPETSYTTYKNVKFMDRNLGAMGNNAAGTAANAYEAYGLYYQWGRKDPFPRANGPATIYLKSIYGETGPALTFNNNGIMTQLAPTGQNLAPAINNPMTFYMGGFANNSWYGALVDIRGNLWADARKTDFDPCPKGWKVASYTNLNGLPAVPNINTNRGGIFSNANGSVGFMPAINRLTASFNGTINSPGDNCYMYTSTVSSTSNNANSLLIQSDQTSFSNSPIAQGFGVRCVKY